MKIEIYADVICPWCYIGKRLVAAALAGSTSTVRWRSFELAPDSSRTPGPTAAVAMSQWWGDRAAERVAFIQASGRAEGLELNLDIARPVNTFDAHRLLHLADHHGVADEAWERLLRGYQTEGLNIADHPVLEKLGIDVGLDGPEIRTMLASDAYADAVRADERRGRELGVSGVPSLVIDDGPPVSAVQPVADLRKLFSR